MAGVTVLGAEYAVINELVLPYDTTVTDARRLGYFKAFRRSLIWFGIGLLIAGVFWLITRWNDPLILFFYLFFLGLSLVRIIYYLVRWLVARSALGKIPVGQIAIRVDRTGMGSATAGMPWTQVEQVSAETPWWSKVPQLVLIGAGQRSVLRLDQIPAVLSTVDNAVRVLSDGQCRIDTRKLDR